MNRENKSKKNTYENTWLQSLVYRVTCHNLTFLVNTPGFCKPDEIRRVTATLPHEPAAQYGEVSGVKQGMVEKSVQLRVSSNMNKVLKLVTVLFGGFIQSQMYYYCVCGMFHW